MTTTSCDDARSSCSRTRASGQFADVHAFLAGARPHDRPASLLDVHMPGPVRPSTLLELDPAFRAAIFGSPRRAAFPIALAPSRLGADDFIDKPFDPEPNAARAAAIDGWRRRRDGAMLGRGGSTPRQAHAARARGAHADRLRRLERGGRRRWAISRAPVEADRAPSWRRSGHFLALMPMHPELGSDDFPALRNALARALGDILAASSCARPTCGFLRAWLAPVGLTERAATRPDDADACLASPAFDAAAPGGIDGALATTAAQGCVLKGLALDRRRTSMPLPASSRASILPPIETLLIAAAGGIGFASSAFRPGWFPARCWRSRSRRWRAGRCGCRSIVARICFVLIGMLLGAVVTPETLRGMATWPLSIALLAVATVGMIVGDHLLSALRARLGLGLGVARRKSRARWRRSLALAADFEADLRGVAIVQMMRVLLVTIGLPGGLALFGLAAGSVIAVPEPAGGSSLERNPAPGRGLGRARARPDRLRFPGGLLFGAMAGSAILHGTGWVHAVLPWWVGSIAVIVAGCGRRIAIRQYERPDCCWTISERRSARSRSRSPWRRSSRSS